MTARSTPLSRLLDGDDLPAKATPMDAFKRARKKWLAGERIDLGKLAAELGIGRATVFRWVGTRENLYGEVISAGFTTELARARAAAQGTGVARLMDVVERVLRALAGSAPLKRFVSEDPELALRVCTSKHSPVQRRCIAAFREAIDELVAEGAMEPALPPEQLAYLLVRIVESFLYRDVITGDDPDLGSALAAIRILCTARPEPDDHGRARRGR